MASKRLNIVIVGDAKDAQRAIQALGNDFDQLDGKSSRLSGGLGKLGAAGGLAFGAAAVGAGALIGYGTKIAADMEQADIAFTTMLGSATQADAFLKDLQAFAASTPFEFPQLQEAASSLVSAGIEADKVIPIMTTLGNVTSGMGTGAEGVQRATVALQQMAAAGKITGEDLNQLRDAGIPVFDLLAAATGKSKEEVAALAQQGKLGRQELEQLMGALESGKGLERFNGLMEAQSQSLSGMISTLKDTATMGLAGIAEPLAAGLKDALPAITGLVSDLTASLGPVVASITSALGPTLSALSPVISTVGAQLGGVLATALTTIAPIVEALAPHIQSFAEQLGGALSSAIQAILPPLGTLLEAAAPILPMFAELAGDLIGALAPALSELAAALAPVITQMVDQLRPIMDQLKPVWQQLGVTLVDFVKNGLAPMLPQLMELSTALLPLIPPLVQVGAELLNALLPGFTLLTPLLVELINAALSVLVPIVEKSAEGWSRLAEILREVIGQPDDLRENFVRGLTAIKDKAVDVFDWFKGLPGMMWDIAKSAGRDLANGIIQGINSIIVAWNNLSFTTPDLPGTDWGSQTFNTPNLPTVPYVAAESGALLTEPTMVLAAESARARRGGGEVVSPLGAIEDTVRKVVGERAGGPVTINIYGPIGDPVEAGRQIAKAFNEYRRAGGVVSVS